MNELTIIPADALARLREKARLNAEVQTWKPEPGDTLEGVIVGSRKVEGPFGEQAQALIQTPDGPVMALWLTKWLIGQMKAQTAELGDLVSVTFLGKEFGKAGKAFNRFAVTVLKA